MSLIVEDGTGLSNAESYISVADASAYLSKFYLSTDPLMAAWTAATGSGGGNAEIALRRCTRDIDALYGASFWSNTLTSTQALKFPRVPFYEYNRGGGAFQSPSGLYYIDPSNAILVTGIPEGLASATAELALVLLNGYDVTGPADRSSDTKREYDRLGGLISEVEYFFAGSAVSQNMRKVSMLLAPYINSDPSGVTYPVARG